MMTTYDDCITIEELLQREINKLPFGDVRPTIYEYPRDVEDIDHGVTSRFGLTKENSPVVEFYTSVIEQLWEDQESFIIKKYSSKDKWIQTIVRHEYRHLEQYRFIKDHNLNMELIFNETTLCGNKNGLLERDAYEYENGIVNDLNVIFGI